MGRREKEAAAQGTSKIAEIRNDPRLHDPVEREAMADAAREMMRDKPATPRELVAGLEKDLAAASEKLERLRQLVLEDE